MLQATRGAIIALMDELTGVKILIVAGREGSGHRWAEMLRGSEACVWLTPDEIPQNDPPELIVTDSPAVEVGEAGVVWIGPAESAQGVPADVRLPEDVTERELRAVCGLLAQLVRLRRSEHRGAKLRRRLAEQALTDPVTGLPNRRAWDAALEERLAEAAEVPGRLCLAVLDLDYFKRINDAHGHAVGDEVLRSSGRAVRQSLREGDFVARLGGDEFGLLLWVPDERTAGSVVDRVRAALPALLAQSATHAVGASAGYHLSPAGCPETPVPSPEVLFAAADAALREAKQQGRDRTVGSGC